MFRSLLSRINQVKDMMEDKQDSYSCRNLQRSRNASAKMGLVGSKTPSKAEVCNLWAEILIQKNIAAFYVPVDYSYCGAFVKIDEPFSCSNNNIQPLIPSQNLNLVLICIYKWRA